MKTKLGKMIKINKENVYKNNKGDVFICIFKNNNEEVEQVKGVYLEDNSKFIVVGVSVLDRDNSFRWKTWFEDCCIHEGEYYLFPESDVKEFVKK